MTDSPFRSSKKCQLPHCIAQDRVAVAVAVAVAERFAYKWMAVAVAERFAYKWIKLKKI